ncbi:MAG: MGMT family protein [Clostridia bacterium]
MRFFENVYEVVKLIPKGKVATYGQIARKIGNPRMSRQVGWALHANPQPFIIPCHRVVNRFGSLSCAFAFNGIEEQQRLLEAEGVIVKDGCVNLDKYLWSELC